MFSERPSKRKKLLLIRHVVGHSMLPVLPPGTHVIATGLRQRPAIGQVVIIEHEGKEKIKRIQAIRDNEVYMVGDNEAASTDSRTYGWLPMATIVARVVWPRRLHHKTPSPDK